MFQVVFIGVSEELATHMKNQKPIESLAEDIMRSHGFTDYCIGLARQQRGKTWALYLERAQRAEAALV